MRKFIFSIIGFIVFFSFIYVIGIAALGKLLPSELRPNLKYNELGNGSTYSMLSDLKRAGNIDILVLGASDAYRSYDPRNFEAYGYKVFNMGSSSQTPSQTLLLLEKYFDKLKPKIVIYEVSPVCFTLDGVESSMDLILNKVDNRSAFRLLLKTPDIMLVNSYIYSKISDILFPDRSVNGGFSTSDETYIKDGYVETKLKFNRKSKIDSVKWIPREGQVKKFRQICNFFKDRKVKYFLVNANSITDRGFSNLKDAYRLFESNGGFIDMNRELLLNDSLDFFDDSHLNQNGVRAFNRYFISKKLKN